MDRRRLGLVLIVLGLCGILWGVFHVLEAAEGPGPSPRTFEQRRSYNQVKEAVHATFLGGCLRAGIGFALIAGGARLRRGASAAPL